MTSAERMRMTACMPSVEGEQRGAAVDEQGAPRHVGGVRRAEEADGAGNLVGGLQLTERDHPGGPSGVQRPPIGDVGLGVDDPVAGYPRRLRYRGGGPGTVGSVTPVEKSDVEAVASQPAADGGTDVADAAGDQCVPNAPLRVARAVPHAAPRSAVGHRGRLLAGRTVVEAGQPDKSRLLVSFCDLAGPYGSRGSGPTSLTSAATGDRWAAPGRRAGPAPCCVQGGPSRRRRAALRGAFGPGPSSRSDSSP